MAIEPKLTIVNGTANPNLSIAIFQQITKPSAYSKKSVAWRIVRMGAGATWTTPVPATYEIALSYPYEGGTMKTDSVEFVGYSQDIKAQVSEGGAITISGQPGTNEGIINVDIPAKAQGPFTVLLSKADKEIVPPIQSNSGVDTNITINPAYYVGVIDEDFQTGDEIMIAQIQDQLTQMHPGMTATVSQTGTSAYFWSITSAA